MSEWRTDFENAPKDRAIYTWRMGWKMPIPLQWKTNHRIVEASRRGENADGLAESYFGDINESDDYEFARPDTAPTHWHLLPDAPLSGDR